MRALVVSPHPDDEVLGAGATLCTLQNQGWAVRNLACTLGRPADRERRLMELSEATLRMNFDNRIMDPLAALSGTDDLEAGARAVQAAVLTQIDDFKPTIVVSPHPHDGHHAHEATGRGVAAAVKERPHVTWWMWSLWSDLPVPSLYVPVGHHQLDTVLHALEAHAGELKRNDYATLYRSRARMNAMLGTERVLGFGSSTADTRPFAELLSEVKWTETGWDLGPPRILDSANPLSISGNWRPCDDLIEAASPRTLMSRRNNSPTSAAHHSLVSQNRSPTGSS